MNSQPPVFAAAVPRSGSDAVPTRPHRLPAPGGVECGDIVRLPLSRHPVYLINHPDLIKDILVTRQKQFKKGRGLEQIKRLLGEGLLTSEGDFHLRQRRLMQPAFHRQRIAAYA